MEWLLSIDRGSKFTLAVVGVTTFIVARSFMKRKKNYPPGPWSWPVLGNIIDFAKSKYIYRDFMEWAKTYGPVFSIRLGMKDYIIINNAELAREAFINQGKHYSGRVYIYTGELLLRNKDITMSQPNQLWAMSRKVVLGAIRKYSHSADLMQRSYNAVDQISTMFAKQGEEPMNTITAMNVLVYNVLVGMCFGKSFQLDDPFFVKFLEINDEFAEEYGKGFIQDVYPSLRHLPHTPGIKRLLELKEIYQGFLWKNVKEHEETYDPDNVSDFAYHVIHAQKEIEKEEGKKNVVNLTMENKFLIILDVFGAGTDTTRNAIQWVVLMLAAHPDVQRTAWEQVNKVVGTSRPVQVTDRPNLPYIEAILNETLRMRPPAPIGLPHLTQADTTLGGYDIPSGTAVFLNIYGLHHDPAEWDEPDAFRPDRFIGEDGSLIARPNSYAPFSLGKRACVGEILAKADLNLLTALIVQRFEFSAPPGENIDLEPLTHSPIFILSKHSSKVVVKPRTLNF